MKLLRTIGGQLVRSCVLALLLASSSVAAEKSKAGVPSVQEPKAKPAGIVTGKKLKAVGVPELDGSSASSAIVLLLGGIVVVFGRKRRDSDGAPVVSPSTQ